jgi:hypothetical protein
VLSSGEVIDLTRAQFGRDAVIENVEPRAREHVLSYPETERRYRRLAHTVDACLRHRLPVRA